ncbi:MAG TPA: hypothetical protein VFD70_28625 [Anaerolineae bacterium]|nr:hypothetical protein [Anaerolineae bacterium]
MSARCRIELTDSRPVSLFYSVPQDYGPLLTESADPFVVAAVFLAMSHKADLYVHAKISSSLLNNLAEYQTIWSTVRPNSFQAVEICADAEENHSTPVNDHAVVTYSGGMDSNFSAWRHSTGRAGRRKRNLKAAVMVQGFDIPNDEPEMFARAVANSRRMLDSVGVELIPMATNFQSIIPYWIFSHGAGLASALMMLKSGFGVGMIAASDPYSSIYPLLGSNPLSDPFLSSQAFEIVHDGAAFSRSQKARQLYVWDECMRYMRVCWRNKQRDRNCCRCDKCIRTILNFRAVGLPRPPCFERDVTLWQIATRGPIGRIKHIFFQEALDDARKNNMAGSWVTLLRIILPIYGFALKFTPRTW